MTPRPTQPVRRSRAQPAAPVHGEARTGRRPAAGAQPPAPDPATRAHRAPAGSSAGRRASRTAQARATATEVQVDPAVPVALRGAPAVGAPTGPGAAPPSWPSGVLPAAHALHRARVSTASVRRFAERARRRRWLTWRPAAAGAGVVVLVLALVWVVWSSSLLAARDVQLVGAQRVTRAEVDAAVASELGRPLARLDADAVRARLEQLPEVRSAQVLRVWPTTVEIRVSERVPVAAVPDGSAFSLLDAEGVQVEHVTEPPAGLPVVAAETVAAGEAPLLAAAQVLQALPPQLAGQVTGTTAATPDSVVLTLASGARVVWGSPDESARKAAVLQVLLATPAEVYDVSAPGTPVTR